LQAYQAAINILISLKYLISIDSVLLIIAHGSHGNSSEKCSHMYAYKLNGLTATYWNDTSNLKIGKSYKKYLTASKYGITSST
jgi:hypothetical protein